MLHTSLGSHTGAAEQRGCPVLGAEGAPAREPTHQPGCLRTRAGAGEGTGSPPLSVLFLEKGGLYLYLVLLLFSPRYPQRSQGKKMFHFYYFSLALFRNRQAHGPQRCFPVQEWQALSLENQRLRSGQLSLPPFL